MRCESFGKFSLVHLAAFALHRRCPARALTLLCGKMRVSLKKGDVNKKFRRGRGYLQIVQERSEVAHSCLSTLDDTTYSYLLFSFHSISILRLYLARKRGRYPEKKNGTFAFSRCFPVLMNCLCVSWSTQTWLGV